MELTGKTAIVTRAGRGIGEAIAKDLGRERASVVIQQQVPRRAADGRRAV